jgi:hypothetical protein
MPRLLPYKRRATYHPPDGGANEKKNWDRILTLKVRLAVSFKRLSQQRRLSGLRPAALVAAPNGRDAQSPLAGFGEPASVASDFETEPAMRT